MHASLDGGTTYGSAVQFVIPAATSIPSWGVSNTLVGFFTKVCTCLGLVLDSSLAIASPPVISGTVSVDTLVLDVADSVAAYFCHYFYIDSGVLHLIDAASVNGAAYNFGLWDYLKSPKYTWLPPVNQVYDDAGKRYILGNTLFGRVLAVGVSYYATDTTYLQKVATYSGLPVVELSAMDFYGQFVPGRLLTWVDDRHAQTIVGSMQMRAVQYDFGASGDRVTIIGSSTLTT